MIWSLAVFILFVVAVVGWFRVHHLQRELDGMFASSPAPTFGQEYNEIISEVSVLLKEKEAQVNLMHELATASAVQEMLLPAEGCRYADLSADGRLIMANGCGGDWWYHCQIDGHVCFWIGDVTGHGVPSALVASACRGIVGAFEQLKIHSPEQAMTALNRVLYPMIKERFFVTAIAVTVEVATGRARVVNASHPAGVHLKARQAASVLDEGLNPPLGAEEHYHYRASETMLDRGDILVLMTDGLLEFPSAGQAIWSTKRLLGFLEKAAQGPQPATNIVRRLQEKIDAERKSADADDITFLAIQRDAA